MRYLKIWSMLPLLIISMFFTAHAFADRSDVTLNTGITRGATHSYPASNAFYAIDDQPVFFKDGSDLYFIKSSPSDSHGWHTRWKGTSMDDLQFDSVVTVHDVSPIWLGGSGWIDPTDGKWYVVGVEEYKYDAYNNPKKITGGGGKSYFHRLWLFTSTDKGLNWYPQGVIITDEHGYDWDYFDRWQFHDWGPGPHTLFVDDRSGYFYLFYGVGWRDWSQDARYENGTVARCPISSKMAPGCWQKWSNGAWGEPGLGGKASSIIPNEDTLGITWNSYLNKYIAFGSLESEIGLAESSRHLWVATATDLTLQNWTAPVFFEQNGDGWYYWITDAAGATTSPTGQNVRFYYGNQGFYQDITLSSNGTYTGYTMTQRLPDIVVPNPAWNGLTNSPDRTEGGTSSDNGASNPTGEGEGQGFDNNVQTKWLVYNSTGVLQYTFPNYNAYAVTRYYVTSGGDEPGRDPKSWSLQGSNDGTNWTTVDSRSNITFIYRKETKEFTFTNSTGYKNYRINVTANNGGAYLQIAEIQLFAGGATYATANAPSPIGKQIWLKAAMNDKYVSAWSDTNTPLQARASAVDAWEKFDVVDAGGGYVALKANANGKYVTTAPNAALEATATTIGTSEEFQLIDLPEAYVALKSIVNGKYVTTTGNLNNPLQAVATTINTWEKFRIYWPQNLALGKLAMTASSSVESTSYSASNAVDGSMNTRWSSQWSDLQWIQVDLGSSQSVGRVVLKWDPAYGKSYKIQTSTDGTTWTDRYSTITGDGGEDVITFTPVSARYVRMNGTERGTGWGYSLWEFEVNSN